MRNAAIKITLCFPCYQISHSQLRNRQTISRIHLQMKVEKSAVVSRSNRFFCFKPVGIEIEPVTDKVLFYPLPHRRKNQMEAFMTEKERKIDSRKEKVSRGPRFSRAVKAFLFQPKSRNRNQESGVGNDSMRSDSSCSFRFMKRDREFESKMGLTKSSSMRSTSSSSSSSCLSSQPSELQSTSVISSSNSNPNSKLPKQSSLKKQSSGKEQISCSEQSSSPSSTSIIIALLLLLLSLTLTIFCGKVCAIMLNAMCLYWIPQKERLTSSRRPRAENEDVERLESSREQRRRVIMEGLLDRSHHHHH